jgi:hypothetical protein
MSAPHDRERHDRQRPPMAPIAVLWLGALLVSGCSKPESVATTTTTATVAASAAPNGRDGVTGAISPPTASPGAAGETSQTAAVSPPANSNGTTPASPGAGPPGGPGLAAAAETEPR